MQDTAAPSERVDPPSRRDFLTRLAAFTVTASAVGASAAALVSYRDDAQAATVPGTDGPEHAWCQVIDLRTCDGCKKCTSACQKRHNLREEQTWIKVFTMEDEHGGTFNMPRPCMMCQNPPCP